MMSKPGKMKSWIEAMRLRTLPVSVAGVIMAVGYACVYGFFNALPAALCMVFAILAQVASNFANEYYDYRDGLDRPGREGPRRGVTEGDITPRAMLTATYVTLGVACAVGCSLIFYSGWWLVPVGIFIALGVTAYSAGPYPLSRHGLGEVAVILFFGVIPVNFTYYLQCGQWDIQVFYGSLSAGLMGANVLIVNNYRDADADAAVGKRTLAVILGRRSVAWLYVANGVMAVMLMWKVWHELPAYAQIVPELYLTMHILASIKLFRTRGWALTPLLGMTATLMLAYSLAFMIIAAYQ